jgi:hypothetical protein
VGFTEEERTRNRQELHQWRQEAIDQFLMQHDVDQVTFDEAELADALDERFTQRDAVYVLQGLKEQGRVHRSAGAWVVGPAPPPMDVDQL